MIAASLLLAVVLSDPGDRYAPLAHEIGARPDDDRAVIWVTSPEAIDDAALIEKMQSLGDEVVPFGIVTGPTPDLARDMWLRSGELRPPRRVLEIRGGAEANATRASLGRDLNTALYATFRGPGAADHWLLKDGEKLTARDVPLVDRLVVATNNAGARPAARDSLAMAFVAKGATGYAGFAWQPLTPTLIGEDGAPFRYSWKGFPIGTIVALQNRALLRGSARVPPYLWIGDPSAAFQGGPPYIHRGPNHYQAPEGWIPLRLLDAARFSYVEIDGLGAADGDALFDRRIVTANDGADKLVLFRHQGGDFRVRLAERAPWWRGPTRWILGGLDQALAVKTYALAALIAGLLLLAATYRWMSVAAWIAGGILAVLHAAYALLRAEHVFITSRAVETNWLAFVATLLLGTAGAMLWSRNRIAGVFTGALLPLLGTLIPAFIALASDVHSTHFAVVSSVGFVLFAAVTAIVYRVILSRVDGEGPPAVRA